ncbi:MAG: hypothetical protein LBL06_00865 [Treponema sp.]|nr:hypothetical protein [Treponema sp.]
MEFERTFKTANAQTAHITKAAITTSLSSLAREPIARAVARGACATARELRAEARGLRAEAQGARAIARRLRATAQGARATAQGLRAEFHNTCRILYMPRFIHCALPVITPEIYI